MLGRCIEDPSNSVIHKSEKFIYDHDAQRIKAEGLSNILINIILYIYISFLRHVFKKNYLHLYSSFVPA